MEGIKLQMDYQCPNPSRSKSLLVIEITRRVASRGTDLETVSTLLGRTTGVQCLVQVGLHGRDVGFHATFVGGESGDRDLQFADVARRLVQFVLGVLACSLRLTTKHNYGVN